jgi:hypothetical protein
VNTGAPRRFNKENKARLQEHSANLKLGTSLISPVPSSSVLRSPDANETAQSATEFASMNTAVMQQRYGVQEGSTDEKADGATKARGNSHVISQVSAALAGSGESKTGSYADESPLRRE